MTKNEIIRTLIKCKLTKILKICILYYNSQSASFYYFDYDSKTATPAQKKELCQCMMSLYKLRDFIFGLSAICLQPNSNGIFVPKYIGFFDSRVHICVDIENFINTLKKQ